MELVIYDREGNFKKKVSPDSFFPMVRRGGFRIRGEY